MKQKLTSSILFLLLTSLGLACSIPGQKHPLTWHAVLEIDGAVPDRAAAVKQAVQVIENRLDALGILNSKVEAQGNPANGQILVSFPDVPGRDRLKKIIIAWGRLELVAVVSPPNPSPVQIYNSQEDATASLGGTVPVNRRVLPYYERAGPTIGGANIEQSQNGKKWVVVESPAVVDGNDLRTATAHTIDGAEDYRIAFSLKPSGAEKLSAWTGTNIKDYIGVVLNDEVQSIAYIKSEIYDQGEIVGRFTRESADDLALVLRLGALPAPLKIVSEGAN